MNTNEKYKTNNIEIIINFLFNIKMLIIKIKKKYMDLLTETMRCIFPFVTCLTWLNPVSELMIPG